MMDDTMIFTREDEEKEIDVSFLYMQSKEKQLVEIGNNQDDLFRWWDSFNYEMYLLENTNRTSTEDIKLDYIRNRIELLMYLKF